MIKQTKTKPQENLEFKKIQSKRTFSFYPPINSVEEGKWLLGVTSLDCTNSVFNITDENNSFSINLRGHWNSNLAERTYYKLNNFLDLESRNNIDLHVKEVIKRGRQVKIKDKDYKLSEFDTFKEEILEELEKAKYHHLEDIVYRFQLTYDEVVDILDFKYLPTKRIGYSLKPNVNQMSDINNTLKKIYPIIWK